MRRRIGMGLGLSTMLLGTALAPVRAQDEPAATKSRPNPSASASAPAAGVAAPLPLYPKPKVALAFNRLYDYPELVDAMRALATAHPDFVSLQSLGKSVEGRDLWCLTLNNPATGPDRSKPAMYVDGNVHGNEIQGAEAALYLAWYLAEHRDRVPKLRTLTDERAFYVVPTINPDGRAHWFNAPNTTSSSRSGKAPRDDDRDGNADEDGYDDIDGDGQVTGMRRKNPRGSWRIDPVEPRNLIVIRPGETVRPEDRYDNLGTEGIDNDGDGLVNEDPPGGYDMNRNWPADWQPDHVQFGAGDYPLSWPETRAIARFILDRPNIAGVQSFHNAGGMILRGPGHPTRQGEYPAADERVAAEIGRVGERMLPFYRSMIIHRDLYPVHGGFVTWTYEHLGIVSFTNELWNDAQLAGRPEPAPTTAGAAVARRRGGDDSDELFASDRLLFGGDYRPWHEVKHPLYGAIEVGGFVKQSQRIPPPFLIEEMCHRNAAFVVYHAGQMPSVMWDEVQAEPLGKADADDDEEARTYRITVGVRNRALIPTVTEQAARRKLGRPDTLQLSGEGLTVAGGGVLIDRDTGEVQPAERNPATLRLESGVGGDATVRVRWFVRGRGKATLRYSSQKGGTLERTLTLPPPG